MVKREKMITRKCDCGCAMFVVEKTIWENGDIDYDISIQDSRYDHNYNTAWGRIKRACKILFGKLIYYSDVYIGEPQEFSDLVAEMSKLVEWQGENNEQKE